jgi:hypothetical protein
MQILPIFIKNRNMRSLILVFFSSLFFAGSGLAQTLKDSASIVQVRHEPRHHDVVDNEWVRILDVHIPPGDTSLFHKHTTPSIFLVLSNTKTGSQALIEPRHRVFSKEGIWFEDFTDTPRIHRVWNADRIPFHTIDIELPHKPGVSAAPPVSDPAFELLFDEKPARGYRVSVAPAHTLTLPARPTPLVVIALTNEPATALVNSKPFHRKGDYLFIPAGKKLEIQNSTSAREAFAVFEIK